MKPLIITGGILVCLALGMLTATLGIALLVALIWVGFAALPRRPNAHNVRAGRAPETQPPAWNALWLRGVPAARGAESVAGWFAMTTGTVGSVLLLWAILNFVA